MKILVVHRQKKTVNVIASVLSEDKPVVLQTESGLDGLLTSRIEHFDLIICGTDLPVVTGFELIRSIRTNTINRDTPVILITDTAHSDLKFNSLVKSLGVEAILPVSEVEDRLKAAVKNLNFSPHSNPNDIFSGSRVN
ncbi:response regulator [Chryseolinea sp. H1M3-3]|uniref:response regulator n=1 Tax=Chryseolinea sp. H1M3-3 TaxID=3034144 RepID=UPI0023ECADF7|nr:response regulator [Chryseolinea sp. H1M3-3]